MQGQAHLAPERVREDVELHVVIGGELGEVGTQQQVPPLAGLRGLRVVRVLLGWLGLC